MLHSIQGGYVVLSTVEKRYKPFEVARVLDKEYGHRLTPSVIRKWDNLILSDVCHKGRKKNEARTYTKGDINLFNSIAVLRNAGYDLQDVRRIMADIILHNAEGVTIIEVKNTIEKQVRGLEQMINYLKMKR